MTCTMMLLARNFLTVFGVIVVLATLVVIGAETDTITGKQYAPSVNSPPGGTGLAASMQRCYVYGDGVANGGDDRPLVQGANLSYYGPPKDVILYRIRNGETVSLTYRPAPGQLRHLLDGFTFRLGPYTIKNIEFNVDSGDHSDHYVGDGVTPSPTPGLGPAPPGDGGSGTTPVGTGGTTPSSGPGDQPTPGSAHIQGKTLDSIEFQATESTGYQYFHNEYFCKVDRIERHYTSGRGTTEQKKVQNGDELLEIMEALTVAAYPEAAAGYKEWRKNGLYATKVVPIK